VQIENLTARGERVTRQILLPHRQAYKNVTARRERPHTVNEDNFIAEPPSPPPLPLPPPFAPPVVPTIIEALGSFAPHRDINSQGVWAIPFLG
jgi:hypothetical protein